MNTNQYKIIHADLAEDVFGGHSDFFEVKIKVSQDFANAVHSGSLPLIFSDQPDETDIEDDLPSANNTKHLAHSIHGYDGHYNLDEDVLTIFVVASCMAKNLTQNALDVFTKTADKLLHECKSAPCIATPKIG